ncbi:hypothetical protein FOQG_19114 [Fusarium oxysporum f. sp. raphani 54005]|uniref:Uncharacterized protein n=1 Tax=Fusarium oxysporum f. sp. raphani 54005 TaxID=1089458 RepID=X0BBD4_FUSOX|nr:hypothetical protein FOQG_19114 [Fusarium oxysporum f. sp. raphani 54005]
MESLALAGSWFQRPTLLERSCSNSKFRFTCSKPHYRATGNCHYQVHSR